MCDLRPEALATLGRRFPAVRQTPQLDEMLEDDTLDAVAWRCRAAAAGTVAYCSFANSTSSIVQARFSPIFITNWAIVGTSNSILNETSTLSSLILAPLP